MRKTTTLYFLLGILMFFSCGEVREEITINKDGSGKYEISSDIIPMMRNMMQGIAAMTIQEGEEADSAAIAAKVEQLVWKDFPARIDSTISLNSELPQEIKDDPEAMKLLEKTTVYMRGGKDVGYIKSGLEFNFKSTTEYEKFIQLLEESGKRNEKTSMFGNSTSEVKITPTSFTRTTESSADLKSDPSMQQVLPMFEDMNVLTILNFQRKIAKIDLVHYEIVKQSDTSVTLKYNFMDALESEEKSRIDIKLK